MLVHPKLAGRTCYHEYEIEAGLFTPGTFLGIEPGRCLDELGIAGDLSGLKVLEIGAWDGAFTFELARRGAAVTALDIQDPDVTVFNAVRDILNVAVTYVRSSVYDLLPAAEDPFDIVVFTGVYYHLKNPALALQRIRGVLRDGGTLYIEGASCSNYLAEELARALPGTSVEILTTLIDRLPVSFFDAEKKIYRHWSNWWFPTTRCLEAMLCDCGFNEVEIARKPNAFTGHTDARLMGRARADAGKPRPQEQRHEHEVYNQDYRSIRPVPYDARSGASTWKLLKRIGRKLRSYLPGRHN